MALLQQQQRFDGDLRHGDVIEADIQDYVIARRLLTGPLSRAFGGGLSDAVMSFARRLLDRYADGAFTSAQVAREDERITAKRKVNEYLGRLADVGSAELMQPSKGPHPAIYRMVEEPAKQCVWLPVVDSEGGFVNAVG